MRVSLLLLVQVAKSCSKPDQATFDEWDAQYDVAMLINRDSELMDANEEAESTDPRFRYFYFTEMFYMFTIRYFEEYGQEMPYIEGIKAKHVQSWPAASWEKKYHTYRDWTLDPMGYARTPNIAAIEKIRSNYKCGEPTPENTDQFSIVTNALTDYDLPLWREYLLGELFLKLETDCMKTIDCDHTLLTYDIVELFSKLEFQEWPMDWRKRGKWTVEKSSGKAMKRNDGEIKLITKKIPCQ